MREFIIELKIIKVLSLKNYKRYPTKKNVVMEKKAL